MQASPVLGSLSRKKSNVSSVNCPDVAKHLLWVTFLCMRPRSPRDRIHHSRRMTAGSTRNRRCSAIFRAIPPIASRRMLESVSTDSGRFHGNAPPCWVLRRLRVGRHLGRRGEDIRQSGMLGLNSPYLRLDIPGRPTGGLWNNWPLFLARHELVMCPIYADTLWRSNQHSCSCKCGQCGCQCRRRRNGFTRRLKGGQNFIHRLRQPLTRGPDCPALATF